MSRYRDGLPAKFINNTRPLKMSKMVIIFTSLVEDVDCRQYTMFGWGTKTTSVRVR